MRKGRCILSAQSTTGNLGVLMIGRALGNVIIKWVHGIHALKYRDTPKDTALTRRKCMEMWKDIPYKNMERTRDALMWMSISNGIPIPGLVIIQLGVTSTVVTMTS